jgi:complex iron-sulfur molybdoenzyme family reductase subunit gamma
MRREELLLAGVLAVALVGAAVVAPTTGARPAFEIPVHYAVEDESLDRADGAAWDEAPAATVPLASSGAAVPASGDVSVERVTVEAARTNERLYLRLTWADATRDTSAERLRSFADAVAVQLPADATRRPPIAMGGPDNRVNVWYWSGAGGGEELLAGGPGSTTAFDDPAVATNASHADGRWRVVFARPLDAPGANRTTIPTDADVDLAVAVWNGSNMERSGQKSVSEWYYLALGPGPEGPPYETILWTIAGLAIVATTLVTIEGVRRTRGE